MTRDWKLKLRFGRLRTNFSHFTLLTDGVVVSSDLAHCKTGPAWLGMKIWATDSDQAIEMIGAIANDVGFEITGEVQVYETEPNEEPRPRPHAYDLRFTTYDD